MALVHANSVVGAFVELDACNSPESLARLLDSQRELFHTQIDQLQKLVVTQCKLTGVNPLSQEMAAGALSIKIGKRRRDLLNPKAIKYMQSIFSIKDTIGKKETREISALCGVTASQVREYLSGQRARVRKLVLLSRQKATTSDASKASTDGGSLSPDRFLPSTEEAPLNAVDVRNAGECTQVLGNSMELHPGECTQVLGNSTDISTGECAQVPEYPTNFNPGECPQVPGYLINLNPVECPQVPKNCGNFNTIRVSQQASMNSTEPKTIEEGPSCPLQEEAFPGIESDEKKFLENIFNLMRKEKTFSGQMKLMEWVLQIHNPAALNWFLTKGGLAILATWLSQAALEEQTTVLLVIFKVLCHLPLHKIFPVQMSSILQTVNRLRFYRTSGISNSARVLLSRWSKLFVRSQALKKPSVTTPKNARKELLRKQRINEILSNGSWQSEIDIQDDILALDGNAENSRESEPRKGIKLLSASCDESSKKHGRSVSSPKNQERRKVLLVEQPDRRAAGRSVQVARAVPSNHSRPLSADDIQKAKMRAMFMQDKYGKTDASPSENQPEKTEEHKPSRAPQAISRLPAPRITPQLLPQQRTEGYKRPSAPATETSPQKLKTSSISKPNSASREQLWEMLKREKPQWRAPPEMKINCMWRVGAGENSKEVQIQAQRIRREKETFYPNAHHIPPDPKGPWDTEMDFDDSLTPEIPAEQPPDAADAAEGSPYCSPRDSRGAAVDDATSSAPPIGNGNCDPEPDLELLAVLLKNPELVFALTSGQGKSLGKDETVALLDMLKKSGVGLVNGPVDGGSSEKPKEPEPQMTSFPSPTPPSDPARSDWRSELQPQFAGNPTMVSQAPALAPIPGGPKNLPPILGLPPQAPTTIFSMPQLTVTINPAPQHLAALNFLTQRPPSSVPYKTPSPMYPLQQSHNPSTFLPQPALLPTPMTAQPPLLSEAPAIQPMTAAWPSSTSAPDSWIGAKGVLEVPAPNSHFHTNQSSNYDMYPNGPMQPHFIYTGQSGARNGILRESEFAAWSPEGSPMRSPELRSGWNFLEQRREAGRDCRPEFPRQWNSGSWDRNLSGGGRRRRRRRR